MGVGITTFACWPSMVGRASGEIKASPFAPVEELLCGMKSKHGRCLEAHYISSPACAEFKRAIIFELLEVVPLPPEAKLHP